MIPISKFLSLGLAGIFFLGWLTIPTGGNISPEFEAEFTKAAVYKNRRLVLNGIPYSIPVYEIWSDKLQTDMFYKFEKGERLNVRVDEAGMVASLEARGEQLVSIPDYREFKRESSSRLIKIVFFLLGIYAALWLIEKRLQR
ncbi:hypothetical protein [Stutzerimonas stutzeri]|uniref:hypothetical protein n=1 Tax=Stutzerimonas stutzeri TaxID=316 RepID=UPI00210D0F3F|nr:hypothetical protein [Stutzerimonas stutzeri]MCQ4261166.1 hypothetical protein [Stutzerimonas stutzeri]